MKKKLSDEIPDIIDQVKRKDLSPCKHWLSTGCTLLDLAISDRWPGGIGGGRITHIYGDASTAKSVIVQEILGAAQRLGGYAILADIEKTFDAGRAKLFGLNIDENFDLIFPSDIEDLYDEEINNVLKDLEDEKLNPPIAFGVDSLTALPAKTDTEEALSKGSYQMARPKQFSKAFRKYIARMADLGLSFIILDQTRMKIGVSFGKQHTTAGGKAKDFYASTKIFLTNKGKIKNKHDAVVGVKIGFEIEKNKIAPPHRKGEFQLLFDVGIDDITSNLTWLALKEHKDLSDKLKQAGSWYTWDGIKKQSLEALVRELEKDANNILAVEKEVARVWRLVHQPTGRRPRHV